MGDKKKIIVIIISIVVLILITYFSYLNKKELARDIKDNDWMSENIELIKDKSMGSKVYKIYKNSDISIFNLKYQKVVAKKINDAKANMKDDYIIIYNPYGTNPLSVNIVFRENDYEEISYEITTSKTDSFKRKISLEKDESMYQIIGLYPGESNKIKLNLVENSKSRVSEFVIDLSDIEINATKKLEVEKKGEQAKLVEGLYAVLGNESDYQNYIALYDNSGIVRSEYPLKEIVYNKLVFTDKSMFYNISKTEIIKVDRLGKITNIYKTGKYRIENYQIYNNDLYVLVTDTKKDTLKSCIIKINIETNEIKEVFSFNTLFKDYISALKKDENGKIDYLNISDFKIIDNCMYISSKETSAFIKIANFLDEAKIEYIISNDLFFEKTPFKELLFNKEGEFKIHAGQSSFNIKRENENTYYLIFFNNNYGNSTTTDFNYNDIDVKNNNLYQGDNSYYYVYKVDEEKKTFELVDSIVLDYSGIGGNVQLLENDNKIINISTKGEFMEIDKDNMIINGYRVKINKNFVYKVEKYSFKNYLFS